MRTLLLVLAFCCTTGKALANEEGQRLYLEVKTHAERASELQHMAEAKTLTVFDDRLHALTLDLADYPTLRDAIRAKSQDEARQYLEAVHNLNEFMQKATTN